jgi:hypothetical protein
MLTVAWWTSGPSTATATTPAQHPNYAIRVWVTVLLLALAQIDDLGAIIEIALFYTPGIQLDGLALAAGGCCCCSCCRSWACARPRPTCRSG